jgi:methionyl aminopeptidase
VRRPQLDIQLKTPEQIGKMRGAGLVVAAALQAMREVVAPGVSTADLDAIAEKVIRDAGAVPSFKGYHGFPASICASPNSMVVHGIPGPYKLGRGDILSVDIGVVKDGWVADAAITLPIGSISPVTRLTSPSGLPSYGTTRRHV